jgi:hypothetical protein
MTGQDRYGPGGARAFRSDLRSDRYRTLTVWAVLLVAAIAATVSFVHIEALATRYGQPPLAAWLLPLSIDGTVAVSSPAMLRAARAAVSAPWLARAMLLLAVGATLACNVGYGVTHGWPGALLSGWPAVALLPVGPGAVVTLIVAVVVLFVLAAGSSNGGRITARSARRWLHGRDLRAARIDRAMRSLIQAIDQVSTL